MFCLGFEGTNLRPFRFHQNSRHRKDKNLKKSEERKKSILMDTDPCACACTSPNICALRITGYTGMASCDEKKQTVEMMESKTADKGMSDAIIAEGDQAAIQQEGVTSDLTSDVEKGIVDRIGLSGLGAWKCGKVPEDVILDKI